MYIYIYRERERVRGRGRGREGYIYIYRDIYIEREGREGERDIGRDGEREWWRGIYICIYVYIYRERDNGILAITLERKYFDLYIYINHI